MCDRYGKYVISPESVDHIDTIVETFAVVSEASIFFLAGAVTHKVTPLDPPPFSHPSMHVSRDMCVSVIQSTQAMGVLVQGNGLRSGGSVLIGNIFALYAIIQLARAVGLVMCAPVLTKSIKGSFKLSWFDA